MTETQKQFARRLSKLNRTDRLLARAVNRAARGCKAIPPGFPADRTRRMKTGELVFASGAAFPKEWL